jgi:hypothetical protein
MVESHTIGVELVDERVMAFTVFLQEDYREQPVGVENAATIGAGIAMSIYEITSHVIRHRRNRELPGLLPLMAYIVLAPFIGVRAACCQRRWRLALKCGLAALARDPADRTLSQLCPEAGTKSE